MRWHSYWAQPASRGSIATLSPTLTVRYAVVLLGINDIGAPASEAVTVDELIAGHRQLIERAHQRGITIFGATLPPFEGATMPGFYTPEGEQKRQAINEWIRRSGEYRWSN